jgi:hypothetical protein
LTACPTTPYFIRLSNPMFPIAYTPPGGIHTRQYSQQTQQVVDHCARMTIDISCQMPNVGTDGKDETLIERKLRVPKLQGVKGLAVVVYAEFLTTQQMWHHRLLRRVNKMKEILKTISHQ